MKKYKWDDPYWDDHPVPPEGLTDEQRAERDAIYEPMTEAEKNAFMAQLAAKARRPSELDIVLLCEELVACHKAESVLNFAERDSSVEESLRAKRSPFLKLAEKMVENEGKRKRKELYEALKQMEEP